MSKNPQEEEQHGRKIPAELQGSISDLMESRFRTFRGSKGKLLSGKKKALSDTKVQEQQDQQAAGKEKGIKKAETHPQPQKSHFSKINKKSNYGIPEDDDLPCDEFWDNNHLLSSRMNLFNSSSKSTMDEMNSPKIIPKYGKNGKSKFSKLKKRRFRSKKALSFSQYIDFKMKERVENLNEEESEYGQDHPKNNIQQKFETGFLGGFNPDLSSIRSSGGSVFSGLPETDPGTIQNALQGDTDSVEEEEESYEEKEEDQTQTIDQKHNQKKKKKTIRPHYPTNHPKRQEISHQNKIERTKMRKSFTTNHPQLLRRENPKRIERVEVDIFGLRTVQKDPRMTRHNRANTTLLNMDSEFKFLKPAFLKSPTTVFVAEPIRMNYHMHIVNQKREVEHTLEKMNTADTKAEQNEQ